MHASAFDQFGRIPMTTVDPTERLALKLAKLNATTVKFDIGYGGGLPGLTAQDIAAALGMVPAGLGRELLEHVHWPDGAARSRHRLLATMTTAQLLEHNRLEGAMVRALCSVATAEQWNRRKAEHDYSNAHAARWPAWVVKLDPITFAEGYGHIRLAVLEELAHPRLCPECAGRQRTDRMGEPLACERCLDTGTVRYGPTWRGMRLGMKRSAFTERWQSPYQWMMDTAQEHIQYAEKHLISALSDGRRHAA